MDKLPNELHHFIAPHLQKKELASYRCIGRRYEAIGAEYLFDTVKFTFDGPRQPPAVIHRNVAQHVKRVHVDNWGTHESTYNGAKLFEKILRDVAHAGANITELRLRLGEDKDGKALDMYATMLKDNTHLIPNLTRLNICRGREFEGDYDYQDTNAGHAACKDIYTAIKALPKLEMVDLIIRFQKPPPGRNIVVLEDLERLWDVYLPYREGFAYEWCQYSP